MASQSGVASNRYVSARRYLVTYCAVFLFLKFEVTQLAALARPERLVRKTAAVESFTTVDTLLIASFLFCLYSFVQYLLSWLEESKSVVLSDTNKVDRLLSLLLFSLVVVLFTSPVFDSEKVYCFFTLLTSFVLSCLLYRSFDVLSAFLEKRKGDVERDLSVILTRNGGVWRLIYNAALNKSKKIIFNEDGEVRNYEAKERGQENESYWRVKGRILEILNHERKVFSRFIFVKNEDGDYFEHTNDKDLLSLPNQKILK